jgi:hypothetical protein
MVNFRSLSQADQQRKKLCGLRQNRQGVLNALRKDERMDIY